MKNLIRFAFLMVCVLTAGSAFATTYYIDNASGADTNSGTSKSAPWKHAPGMAACSNNCASASPGTSDQFILKGGVIWHVDSFPWTWSWQAAYVGVDKTWFAGASWTRPIMNGDNPTSTSAVGSCAHTISPNNTFLSVHQTAVFDNFEFTGLCNDGSVTAFQGNSYLTMNWGGDTYENMYFHGWTHTAGAPDTINAMIGGSHQTDNEYDQTTGVLIDGSDSDPTSGTGIWGSCYDVDHTTIQNTANGIVCNNMHTLHDNNLNNLHESYDSGEHSNVIETNAEWCGNGPNTVYNNVEHDNHTGVHNWTLPCSGQPDYYFNNVIYNVAGSPGNCWNLSNSGATVYFINNIVVAPCEIQFASNSPSFNGTAYFTNNQFVGYGSPGTLGSVIGGGGSVTTNETAEIYESSATAAAQGYTASNGYQPASGGSTIGAGTNLTSSCTGLLSPSLCLDNLGVQRPASGAWDVGAFQFSGSGTTQSTAPSPPSNLAVVVQ